MPGARKTLRPTRGPAIPFAALSPVFRFVQAASSSGPVQEIRATASEQEIDLWVLFTDEDQKAEEEINAQGGRFALTRNYDKAKELLAKAKADAEKAKADTGAAKEKAKGEAQAAQKEAQAALSEAKAMLAKAPKGKGTKADIEAMQGDLKTAEGMLPEIQAALDKEDYLGAKAKAQSVKDRAASVSGQVQQAMKQKGKAGKK